MKGTITWFRQRCGQIAGSFHELCITQQRACDPNRLIMYIIRLKVECYISFANIIHFQYHTMLSRENVYTELQITQFLSVKSLNCLKRYK